MDAIEQTPSVPHLTGEFYAWLWWTSDVQGGTFDLGTDIGRVDLWVDDRLAFRSPNDQKVTAVMTGEDPSNSLEARAAMIGGKVVQEIRVRVIRDEREFVATLKGPELNLASLKLPQVLSETVEEAVYDRMFAYEEFCYILSGLLRQFGEVRTNTQWATTVLPGIQQWLQTRDPAA